MSHSLVTFHFNPQKAAQIFKQLKKERGISDTVLAARTGLSYDTVTNCLKGRSDLSFERVFKFCTVLGLPIESVMRRMLKDEHIDFADDVLLYNISNGEQLPISDDIVSDVPNDIPPSVADAATAAAALPILSPVQPGTYTKEELTILLDRQERQHHDHTQDLRAQLAQQAETIKLLISLVK